MYRALAIFVTVCLGILIPAVSSPIRVCFLDDSVLMPGFTTYGETSSHKEKCCTDCGNTDDGESCCFDLKKIPDAECPKNPLLMPSLVCCDVGVGIALPLTPVLIAETVYVRATPIRAPDSPRARRALLAIWNI